MSPSPVPSALAAVARAWTRAGRLVRVATVAAPLLATGLFLAWWRRTPPSLSPLPPPALSPSPPLSPSSPAPPVVYPSRFSVPNKALPPAAELAPGTARILVLGDSVAQFLGVAMRYRQDEANTFVAERGVGQCSIFEAKTRIVDGKPVVGTSCSATWVEDVAELRPDVTLIVQGGAFFNEQACDPPWLASYERRILDLVEAMGVNAGRVVIARVPYPMGDWRHGNVLERVDCFNAMLPGAVAKAHLQLLDLMGQVCPTRACTVESQGKPLRPDGLHFDGVGAEETARWVLGELRRLAGSSSGSGQALPTVRMLMPTAGVRPISP